MNPSDGLTRLVNTFHIESYVSIGITINNIIVSINFCTKINAHIVQIVVVPYDCPTTLYQRKDLCASEFLNMNRPFTFDASNRWPIRRSSVHSRCVVIHVLVLRSLAQVVNSVCKNHSLIFCGFSFIVPSLYHRCVSVCSQVVVRISLARF